MKKLSPQKQKIIALHSDGAWHCSTEIEFIRDARKRISELNAEGYSFEAKKCDMHVHHSPLLMRRLVGRPKVMQVRLRDNADGTRTAVLF